LAENGIRIQKVMAQAGVASRRASEEMIAEGRVRVNGQVVRDLPIFVDPSTDEIRVDGKPLTKAPRGEKKVYFLLNKPKGVVCTQKDELNRPRAVDLLPDIPQRVYCVGRLDQDSTGLVLLTNDGELTNYLTHPRHEVEKTYVVEIDGKLNEQEVQRLKRGIYLDGNPTGGAGLKVLRRGRNQSLLEIRLREGRNREIRRILARLGHKVRKLKRVAIGPVTSRGLKAGSCRKLSVKEVEALRHTGKGQAPKPRGARGGGKGGKPQGRGRGDSRSPSKPSKRKDQDR
jgi:pseudouridine synthase